MISSTGSRSSRPSGVTISSSSDVGSAISPSLPLHRLRLLEDVLDGAGHVERLLRQVVELAVHDLLEAPDRVLERDVLAGGSGEHLGDVERLRQELLDLARARDGLLVLLAELVDRSEERRVGKECRSR